MPKVSKVGKFRKTTASVAVSSSEKKNTTAPFSALTTPAGLAREVATTASTTTTTLPKDHGDVDLAATAENTDSSKNGNGGGVPQKSSETTGRDSSSLTNKKQTQEERQQQPLLSRGQRKRMAKREQYLKREQMVLSSLELKRQEDQKKRIDGLDAMKKALLDTIHLHSTKSTDPTTTIIKTNKSRQRLVEKEVTQMSLVLQHPSFQADPFTTIRQHLQNTIPQPSATAAIDDPRKAKRNEKRAIKKMNDSVIKRKHYNKKRVRPTRSKTR